MENKDTPNLKSNNDKSNIELNLVEDNKNDQIDKKFIDIEFERVDLNEYKNIYYTILFNVTNINIIYKSELFYEILTDYYKKNNSGTEELGKMIITYIKSYIDNVNENLEKDACKNLSSLLLNILKACIKFSGLEIFENQTIKYECQDSDNLKVVITSLSRHENGLLYLLLLNALYRFGFKFELIEDKANITCSKDSENTYYKLKDPIKRFKDFKNYYIKEKEFYINNFLYTRNVDTSDFGIRIANLNSIPKFYNEIIKSGNEELGLFLCELLSEQFINLDYEKCKCKPKTIDISKYDKKNYKINKYIVGIDSEYHDRVLLNYFGVKIILNPPPKCFSLFMGSEGFYIKYEVSNTKLGIEVLFINFV